MIGIAVLHAHRHEQPGHDGEVERHVALVAAGGRIAEIGDRVLRPLVGLGQQHAVGKLRVHVRPQLPEELVRLRQVLVVRPLALEQVGDGVQPQAVHPHLHPEVQGLEDLLAHPRVVEVQVRLVREEAMPVVGVGHRVAGPVRGLGVGEDDARAGVLLVRVAPDVEVALRAPRRRQPRALEPRVLVRRVVDHQLGDHLEPAPVGLVQENLEVLDRAVGGMDAGVVGDVVAVVAPGGGIERQDPDRRHPQVAQVVELGGQPLEVAAAVAVRVEEGPHVDLVDDGVLVPERIVPPLLPPLQLLVADSRRRLGQYRHVGPR